jgi:hypothetical protein
VTPVSDISPLPSRLFLFSYNHHLILLQQNKKKPEPGKMSRYNYDATTVNRQRFQHNTHHVPFRQTVVELRPKIDQEEGSLDES